MITHPPLKRIGGKGASARHIVSLLPAPPLYRTYIEPCAGACHVFFAKPPYDHEAILNDYDGLLINFWREMQLHAAEMRQAVEARWYSRELYYEYYRSLFHDPTLSSFERAVRWFYCLRSTGTGWLRKSPVGWDYRPSNARAMRSAVLTFEDVSTRLCGVSIDNRDVLDTIRRYDGPGVLFYIDPPYIGSEGYYEASKKGFPHAELAQLLQTIRGYVALSYYPHPSIDTWYPPGRWRRETWEVRKSSQIQIPDRGDMATEQLIMNYPAANVRAFWVGSEASA